MQTALCYLLLVLPRVTRELEHWHVRAERIPDAELRRHALQALAKRGNMEGAALFATIAPRAQRRTTVRALVAFQTAYNYLDALAELPSEDPRANSAQLHRALFLALHPDRPHADYYAHSPARDDGGYLRQILDACRQALAELPSYAALAPSARRAASRIVDFQTLNLSESQGGHDALRRWASAATPAGSGLAWWETAAGAGSSLALHALIAAAATPGLDGFHAEQIELAYWPWTGALHTLLDSLVDRREDRRDGRRCLLDYYRSQPHAAIRLASLAARARESVRRVPRARAHRVILTAMCSHYLCAPQCEQAEARAITRALTGALGAALPITMLISRTRRVAAC